MSFAKRRFVTDTEAEPFYTLRKRGWLLRGTAFASSCPGERVCLVCKGTADWRSGKVPTAELQ